jgi:hypothetical protein
MRNPSWDLPAEASERHAGRASLRPRRDLPADRTHSEEPLDLQRERVSKSYRGHLDKALINLNHGCAFRHRKKPFEVCEDEGAINELLINDVQYLSSRAARAWRFSQSKEQQNYGTFTDETIDCKLAILGREWPRWNTTSRRSVLL